MSGNIIDQCVAQGVPFTREYGGHLENRSFGGAQVSRTFYAHAQTGQQLLLGAYGALMKEVARGNVELYTRREMLDLIVADNRAVGIVCRNLVTGRLETHTADAVILATGGYGNVYLPLDELGAVQRDGHLARTQARGVLRQSLFHADPSHVHSRARRLPVQADAHERKPAQRRANLGAAQERRPASARRDPRRGTLVLSSKSAIPVSATSCRATSRHAPPSACAMTATASAAAMPYTWTCAMPSREGTSGRRGEVRQRVRDVQRIIDEDPYKTPMRIYPGRPLHHGRSVGRLQPDEQPSRDCT